MKATTWNRSKVTGYARHYHNRVRSSYVSTVPYRIEQEKFMSLNEKLGSLPISLSFWIILVLTCFRLRHATEEETKTGHIYTAGFCYKWHCCDLLKVINYTIFTISVSEGSICVQSFLYPFSLCFVMFSVLSVHLSCCSQRIKHSRL